MIARATADAMIDRARELQTKVDRGEADGREKAIQASCGEILATIDAYLAALPLLEQKNESQRLVARLMAPATKYQATVPPKRRTVQTFNLH